MSALVCRRSRNQDARNVIKLNWRSLAIVTRDSLFGEKHDHNHILCDAHAVEIGTWGIACSRTVFGIALISTDWLLSDGPAVPISATHRPTGPHIGDECRPWNRKTDHRQGRLYFSLQPQQLFLPSQQRFVIGCSCSASGGLRSERSRRTKPDVECTAVLNEPCTKRRFKR